MASVPTGLTPAALGPRTPYHHPSLPFVLLWSEKSGCTSLLTWFLHHIGKLDDARTYSDWIHDWEHEVMKAAPGYDQAVLAALEGGAPAIKLVRDPFDRAVSSFFMMSVLGDDSGHFTVDLRRSLRSWLYDDPDVPYGFGFVDFLRWMGTVDPGELNPHLGPQSTTLEDRLPSVELIRLDRFGESMRELEARFGLPASDLDAMSSSSHHTVRATTSPTDPGALGRVHFPIPTPRDWQLPPSAAFADDETVSLVTRLFAEDYERYGFDPPAVSTPTARTLRAPAVDGPLDDAPAPLPRLGPSDDIGEQAAELEELRRYAAALRAALDDWESSRIARLLTTLRGLPARLRRSAASGDG